MDLEHTDQAVRQHPNDAITRHCSAVLERYGRIVSHAAHRRGGMRFSPATAAQTFVQRHHPELKPD